jgi:hypothetical protein
MKLSLHTAQAFYNPFSIGQQLIFMELQQAQCRVFHPGTRRKMSSFRERDKLTELFYEMEQQFFYRIRFSGWRKYQKWDKYWDVPEY